MIFAAIVVGSCCNVQIVQPPYRRQDHQGQRKPPIDEHVSHFSGCSFNCVCRVNQKVAPLPGSPSAHTLPPWRLMILSTVARPIPCPLYSSVPGRCWKGMNSFSAYAMSKPVPLSRTK